MVCILGANQHQSVVRISVRALLGCAAILLCGCAEVQQPQQAIVLATTTSTRDSGLLDELLPIFTEETGIQVKVVAVGSGQALAMGRRGDADVLLTHAPAAEEKFMAAGWGELREVVMFNDFVIVGPAGDPAEVKAAQSAVDAFRRIARARATFVSRGDDSGTHKKERALWDKAGVVPGGAWYRVAGAGMAQALRIASELNAYTLSDRSTYLFQQQHLDCVILFEGDPDLLNQYSVIVVNWRRHPSVKRAAAHRFVRFLLAPETQQRIARYGVDRFGQPLFRPRDAQVVVRVEQGGAESHNE